MIRTFLALLLLAAPAAAQTTNRALCEPSVIEIQADLLPDEAWAEIDTRAAEMPNGTGRLWRVTSPEGAVSHLWGTMHSADPRISNPPQILRDLIADADTVMLEYIASHITQRDAEGQLGPQNYTQAAPHNLLEKLPQEAAIGLSARLTQYGHTEEEIPYLSPGYLFYTALSHPCGDRYAMAGFPIQDTRIEMLAADAGHRLEPLDPPDMLYTFSTTKKWARPFE
ncbi:MAG: TraB/GumN family protein, partial [Pseudomonadota bacterium]